LLYQLGEFPGQQFVNAIDRVLSNVLEHCEDSLGCVP
jgi:hypothetical protein